LKYLAIGDIHGCYTALTTLVRFAPYRDAETIVFLGDYVDRGPQSADVLDWLVDEKRDRDIVTLRGNHEVMMLDARARAVDLYSWLHFGGDTTLASYNDGRPGRLEDVPNDHWEFLEQTESIFVAEDVFFVHAGVAPYVPLDQQQDDTLYWQKLDALAPPHESGKRMICGHTSQHSGIPLDLGHSVCIDTWVYGDGWLTALDVQSGKYWQANEAGETRGGKLG